VQLMVNVSLNNMLRNDDSDWSLSSFELPLADLRWGERVSISEITEIQVRVYTDPEKGLIDACEAKYPEISHSPLKKMLYGHPMYDGIFPCCVPPAQHLKGHVEKLVLGEDRGLSVNEESLFEVKTHLSNLTKQKVVHYRETALRELWIPSRIIEDRQADRILSDAVLEAKLHDSSKDRKDWIAVIKSLNLPWSLLFL
jgi:hypothetical protein